MFDTLSRYVLRQCGTRFLLLFALFMAVLVGGQLGIFIGQGVSPEACLPLLQHLVNISLPIALPLALSTAILVILGTMNQEGELRALAASGVSHVTVATRTAPFVALAVVCCLLLTNWVMPSAIASLRASRGHLAQTMIAQRVATGEPVVERDGLSAWVDSTDGSHLRNAWGLIHRPGVFIAIFAPEAHWVVSERGVHLQFTNAQMLERRSDGRLVALNAPVWDYLWGGDDKAGGQVEPDGLSTPQVYELTQHRPPAKADQGDYNNARLTLQFRFFLPASLIAFALFALGLGLTFGTSQNLPGILIVVIVVAASIYPAIGYVKTNSHQVQINPGWLLWPPSIVVGLVGAWMIWRPDRAREIILAPANLLPGWMR